MGGAVYQNWCGLGEMGVITKNFHSIPLIKLAGLDSLIFDPDHQSFNYRELNYHCTGLIINVSI